MRVSLVDVYSNYHEVVYVLSLSVVLKQVEQARREPDRVGTTRAKRIEDAFETWNGFAPAAWLRSQTERRGPWGGSPAGGGPSPPPPGAPAPPRPPRVPPGGRRRAPGRRPAKPHTRRR